MGMYNVAASAVLTATGTLKNHDGGELGGICVKGIYLIGTDAAGSLTFRDGGATGPVRLVLPTPALSDATMIEIPGRGLMLRAGAHVTVDGVAGLVVFYG